MIQILYDKGFFDNNVNAVGLLKESLLIEVNDRRRPDLEEIKEDNVIYRFCSKI